ncbi:MAG TPA: arginine--tRNA ligase [Chloroflexota bacterium]
MIRDELREVIEEAVRDAFASGALPAVAMPDVAIERPSSDAHGDYACSVALKMARAARMAPMAIADVIVAQAHVPASVEALDVAAPGFINFRLSTDWLRRQVDAILKEDAAWGSVEVGQGKRVQVEFVSANPTGPLHVGTGRGAALGDSLARVLEKAGYRVEREYYVNDAGSRMEAFNLSVQARYRQHFGHEAALPSDGYPGDYVSELAAAIADREGDRFLGDAGATPSPHPLPEGEGTPTPPLPLGEAGQGRGAAAGRVRAITPDPAEALGRLGVQLLLDQIREDLERLGVRFDRWFYEQSLFDEGKIDAALDLLRQGGRVVEREGAIWFTSASVGEDRDNVLVRSNGLPTYFASDVAYHRDKFIERGFDMVVDVWGADHQGHVPRMKAVVEALGVDPARLVVLLYQLVNLVRGGRPVPMGKRTGEFVTLREVLDEVGPDPIRFFLVGRSPDAMMDFDLDLAKAQSDVNPVYYVQYAHARTAGILRRAAGVDYLGGDISRLQEPAELAMIRKLLMLPEIVADAALALAPHPLPHFGQELATVFHTFYDQCRVISEDEELTRARLKLVAACQLTLRTTLDLIGVSAPESM